MKEPPRWRWLTTIAVIFVACLITSNIMAFKIVSVAGMTVPAAVVVFPMSYIIGDVLTEVYGYSEARKVIWLGFVGNALAVLMFWLGQILPAAPFWQGQAAYDSVLGFTPRLLGASFLAYLVGEFSNSLILAKMKIWTHGRWLWTRTIGSTLVGEGLDSLVFITFAFWSVVPTEAIWGMVITQWLVKTCYEVLFTPITYAVVWFLKKQEGVDIFDRETRFSPFAIRE